MALHLGGRQAKLQMKANYIHRVPSFRIVGPYTLGVWFNDETEQIIDFHPVLEGELYGQLQDRELFDQVSVDDEVHTFVWLNGADFDPATLHYWPDLLPRNGGTRQTMEASSNVAML